MDIKKSEATRYLCAAPYLDSAFRDYCVRELIAEKHKAMGPCYGVDIVAVAKHCLAARRRRIKRDLWLAIVFSFSPVAFFLLSGSVDNPNSLLVLIGGLLIAFTIVSWDRWSTRSLVTRHLMKGKFDPDALEYPSGSRVKGALEELARRQNANVVIYSGFSPFVGSGIDIGGWSFALNIQKGTEQFGKRLAPVPFSVSELYTHLDSEVRKLNLDRVSLEDVLYVHGQDIRGDPRFLSNSMARPNSQVDAEVVKAALEQPSQTVRHYRCIRVIDWGGELVLSIFLRFSRVSGDLFVEASYFLLPALAEKYHAVDRWNARPSFRERWVLFVQAAFRTPFLYLWSPLSVLSEGSRWLRRRSERKQLEKEIKENAMFDYGASNSVRQVASDWSYRRYFQKLDKDMYMKLLERQILDSIIAFLESRNVDTSDLKERQTTILNSGVIISGGSITAESLAVGRGARGVVSRITRGERRPAKKAAAAAATGA